MLNEEICWDFEITWALALTTRFFCVIALCVEGFRLILIFTNGC
jgi:hypothetical protein